MPRWPEAWSPLYWRMFVSSVCSRIGADKLAAMYGADRSAIEKSYPGKHGGDPDLASRFYSDWAQSMCSHWFGDVWSSSSPECLERRRVSVSSLCSRVGVSVSGLSGLLGVSRSLVSKWLSGERSPSLDCRVAMGVLWEIPVEKRQSGQSVPHLLASFLSSSRVSVRKLSKVSGLSRQTLRSLLSGSRKARSSTLLELADAIEGLCEREKIVGGWHDGIRSVALRRSGEEDEAG